MKRQLTMVLCIGAGIGAAGRDVVVEGSSLARGVIIACLVVAFLAALIRKAP